MRHTCPQERAQTNKERTTLRRKVESAQAEIEQLVNRYNTIYQLGTNEHRTPAVLMDVLASDFPWSELYVQGNFLSL